MTLASLERKELERLARGQTLALEMARRRARLKEGPAKIVLHGFCSPNRARCRALTVARSKGQKRVAVGEREKAATNAFGDIQGIDNEYEHD